MVRQDNIPPSSEERHVDSESGQIPAVSKLACKQASHSHKILMLIDGTHKLVINTKDNRESEKDASTVEDDHIQTLPKQNTSQ